MTRTHRPGGCTILCQPHFISHSLPARTRFPARPTARPTAGGDSYVNIEYEASAPFDLQKVQIAIPLPALAHAPTVNQVRAGAAGLGGLGLGARALLEAPGRAVCVIG